MPRYPYKLKPSTIDENDNVFVRQMFLFETLPSKVDLSTTKFMPGVLDQGQLGSCASNATSNALRYCLAKESAQNKNINVFQPARLYIYYFARMIDGSPLDEDTGITIKSGIRAVQWFGAPSEVILPYKIDDFAAPPSPNAVVAANTFLKKFNYYLVQQDLMHIKQALAAGYPIIFGVQVYSSFESEKAIRSGVIPVPDTSTEELLGGHAILMVGYDDETKMVTIMNSWGSNVGNKGFFKIPYDYILDKNLASEFWTIKYFD